MSRCEEQPVWFDCEGQRLLGIVARPLGTSRSGMGVIIALCPGL
jgi:hypothetical protein